MDREHPGPADHPAVTVKGQIYTPAAILARNMGTDADQTAQFPPHRIIANIYYVGTNTLSSFLIVTPQGNILMDSTYERNVPVIQKSVTDLGFKFSDIRILLGNHAHADHQEGDAMVKAFTGAPAHEVAHVQLGERGTEGDHAWWQGAPDRPDRSRWRHRDARRHDAGSASDGRPYARLYDLDDHGA